MIKWNNLDEMGNEFVYRKAGISAYIIRQRNANHQVEWSWQVINTDTNTSIHGFASFADACFYKAEKAIEWVDREGI